MIFDILGLWRNWTSVAAKSSGLAVPRALMVVKIKIKRR